ncbi:hypothetical protein BGZ60DRAFT_206648 [Tricladium varicosporioides]|nr:hypothetical protein BGZ60DRAFT_206648 [Hymenoscyphus varicosporioides]
MKRSWVDSASGDVSRVTQHNQLRRSPGLPISTSTSTRRPYDEAPVPQPQHQQGESQVIAPPDSRRLSGPQLLPPRTSGSNHSAPHQRIPITHDALPSITRRVTACAACRKQKIKCIMTNDEPPCARCIQRGLSCVLNRSLQSLVNDTRQIEALQGDVVNLHSILTEVCRRIDIEIPLPLQIAASTAPRVERELLQVEDQEPDPDAAEGSPPMSPSDMQAPIDTFFETAPKVAESPISAVVESPRGSVTSKKTSAEADLISKGIITVTTAERLVTEYLQRLDHYLYGIGGIYTDLKSLRKASPVLLAAVCAISALHEDKDPRVYEACSQEFLSLVSKSMFEQRGVEFLRALCIGSFWLADASRILNSDALRRAADVRLQKYFYQVTVPDSAFAQSGAIIPTATKVDRVRLWYLLYICDQHLSILYNRDPIVHGDQDVILGWEAFLESGYTDDSDIRIASQVSLLQIMSQARTAFGPESIEPVPKALATSFSNFNRQIDQWVSRFSTVFKVHEHIGDFPHKGLTLHYHFAKLYLGHHVFRGLKSNPIPVYFLPAAMMAHGAAISIFEILLNDSGLTTSLIGVPFYFHVMISFAGHFLLSCSQYGEQLSINVHSNLNMMGKVIQLFKSIPCIAQHPLQKMAAALERRHYECQTIVNKYPELGALDASQESNQQAIITQWGNNILADDHRDQPPKSMYGNASRGALPNTNDAIIQTRSSNLGITNIYAGSRELSNRYAILSPNGEPTLEMGYQDFGGFDFPDLQMNFAP